MAVTASGLAGIHGTLGSARFLDPFVFPPRFVVDAQTILDWISLEVSRAFRSEVAAGQRIELFRTAVVEAQENLCLVRVKYRKGDATPTDIVDAETALTRDFGVRHAPISQQVSGRDRRQWLA